MGLPPYDRWKIQIGHNEGGLVHIQPSRYHFAPWILKFGNDSICHWSSKERYSRGNFGFVFGSDHIKITVKVPEISRGRPYEIMLAEARRLLQPYSFRYGEYHYAAGKMEEAPDYTIRLEEDQTIAVKRAELSNASPVFARFFEQNNFKENVLGIYDLSDSDTQTNGFDIHDFVLFCCTGKIYPKTMNNMVEDMASLADMYQVPGLVRLCEILMVAEVENYLDKSAEFWQRKLRVATLLKLDLVLIAVHLVQKERCEKWTKSMRESWFRYLAENPDLVVETYKALAVSRVTLPFAEIAALPQNTGILTQCFSPHSKGPNSFPPPAKRDEFWASR